MLKRNKNENNLQTEENKKKGIKREKEKALIYIMRQGASKDALKFISVGHLLLGK